MKLLVTIATALAFAATFAIPADAGPRKKKKRAHAYSYSKYYRHRHDDSIGGYYEHRLEALRFGSQRWWHVYQQQRGPRG